MSMISVRDGIPLQRRERRLCAQISADQMFGRAPLQPRPSATEAEPSDMLAHIEISEGQPRIGMTLVDQPALDRVAVCQLARARQLVGAPPNAVDQPRHIGLPWV